uniref:F-box protein AT5G49610-like beta-propeller domain-containing protein n=1 Tax=Leersia perrieri TaxID=77586 RepID=A0A0D9XCI1_9ORYZ
MAAAGRRRGFVPSSPDAFDRRYFSFDFLPFDRPRKLIDSRGSLLLFNHGPWGNNRFDYHQSRGFPDLIVCEPLTRRFQGIVSLSALKWKLFIGAFLVAGENGGGGGISLSNYRVVCVLGDNIGIGGPRACVFFPGSDGGWHMGRLADDDDVVHLHGPTYGRWPSYELAGRAAGKIYWWMNEAGVLALDETTLRFSTMELPQDMSYGPLNFRVINGVDGAGAVRVVTVFGEDFMVYSKIVDTDGSGSEWVTERSLRLSDATSELPGHKATFFEKPAKIVMADDRFVTLAPEEDMNWRFSVDLETMELERDHERNRDARPAYPYTLPPLQAILRGCAGNGPDGTVATAKDR